MTDSTLPLPNQQKPEPHFSAELQMDAIELKLRQDGQRRQLAGVRHTAGGTPEDASAVGSQVA